VDPSRQRSAAGAFLTAAGALTLMGIITAEALYPHDYSTAINEISDLGQRTADGVILQPSGYIFTTAMVLAGLATITAGSLLLRASYGLVVGGVVLLNGVGTLGVGLFPSSDGGLVHVSFAVTSFVAGGLCGIAGSRSQRGALRWASLTLGVIVLLGLLLFGQHDGGITSGLGVGGAERWIAYPVVLWQVMFGGALMAGSATATAAGHVD
jgi:hypothetical membrane protein